jgi:dethiobiotin synthetase
MSVVFITGSGTGVGKTYVASLLLRELRRRGREVRAFKPVATGMATMDDASFADTDTARLLRAQGLSIDAASVAACTPWRFALPLSPDMAAAAEGRTLQFATIVNWARAALAPTPRETAVLIEGVGGVMSPIATDALNIDLITALQCPAVLVSGSYLGAINHALTAIEALRVRNVALEALVLSETVGSSVDFTATLSSLSRFAADVRIVPVAHGGSLSGQLGI